MIARGFHFHAAIAALGIWAAAPAQADERILRFLSDVQVRQGSSVDVTETIDVRAEHDRINHGIFRDFPTRYRGPHGGQIHVGFSFEGATLDGAPVPAVTQPIAGGVRVKIGDANRFVEVGEHEYVIRYRPTREIGFFNGYDELYWNATGNGWIFPIDLAEAHIRLPAAVTLRQRSVYTGPQGSTASNAEVVDEKPGDITFRTTQPLGPNEGLTVAVAFPKGVTRPQTDELRQRFLQMPPSWGCTHIVTKDEYEAVASGAKIAPVKNVLMLGPGTRIRWNHKDVKTLPLTDFLNVMAQMSPRPELMVDIVGDVPANYLEQVRTIIRKSPFCSH